MTEATNQGAEPRLERAPSRTGRLAADLSEALPVLEIDDLPQQGAPVIASSLNPMRNEEITWKNLSFQTVDNGFSWAYISFPKV